MIKIKIPISKIYMTRSARIVLFLVWLAWPAAAQCPGRAPGGTFYVDSVNGDDTGYGTSWVGAFKTLNRGVVALNKAGGDTLVLKGKFQETLNIAGINPQADPNSPTLIKGLTDEQGNRLAVIDGGVAGAANFPFDCQGKPPGFGEGKPNLYLDPGISITDSNYITLDGMEVRGIAGKGIWSWKSNHMKVQNVKVEWTALSAMEFYNGSYSDPPATDLTVFNSRINQSNLGRWRKKATPGSYEMFTETLSIVKFDGFAVENNHISNSLMEGIDFKIGAKNGVIRNNIVEQTRSVGIYANEGLDTKIHQNIIRRIGYYDPEDASGVQVAVQYAANTRRYPVLYELGAVGLLIANGDLNGPGRPNLETGRVSGIEVFQNEIS
jgi:hypothetical protein